MTRRSFRPPSALLLVVFGVCMVSYSGPLVKAALLAGATPAAVALVRMLSAGLLLLPPLLRKSAPRTPPFAPTLSHWLWVLLAAFFLAGHYLTWITSLTATSTFASVALVCTQPLFVALFSYLLFHETIPRRAWPGALIALLGAGLIALAGLITGGAPVGGNAGSSSGGSTVAALLALLGAALMAAHWLVARRIRQDMPVQVYTPALYLCTAALVACSLPFTGGFAMPAGAFPYMAGLVLGSTLLGHALFSYALNRVSASVVSFALLGEPVGAMLFAMLFLGEIPSPWVLAGGGLTLLGLCLYLTFASKPEREQSPQAP